MSIHIFEYYEGPDNNYKKIRYTINTLNKYIFDPLMYYNFGHEEPEDVLLIKDGKTVNKIAYMYVNDSNTESI